MFHPFLYIAVITAAVVGMMAAVRAGQAPAVDEILRATYPDKRLEPEEASDRQFCHKVTAVAADGAPEQIVAGYTDGLRAILRILKRDASGAYSIAYDSPPDLKMMGWFCKIDSADLDGDSIPEILFSGIQAKGHELWVFRSTSDGLENLTPLEGRSRSWSSSLSSAYPVDLNHDGTLQVLTATGAEIEPGGRIRVAATLYRMSRTRLVSAADLLLVDTFRSTDPAFLGRASFNQVVGKTGPYVLRLINGVRGGKKRATGVNIKINGIDLPGATALNEKVEFLDISLPPTLGDSNTLQVIVAGPPDAEVTVVIHDS